MNVAALIIDYVLLCEKRSEHIDLRSFIPLWQEANEIAERTLAENAASDMSDE